MHLWAHWLLSAPAGGLWLSAGSLFEATSLALKALQSCSGSPAASCALRMQGEHGDKVIRGRGKGGD